jgi:hypothetical protein
VPGSTQVSATASDEPGTGLTGRFGMAPYTRTAIQMGVAVGGAVALGDALSAARFYWAVIAAFVTFMGANNSGEQIRKALFRVAGTLVGIAVGSGVVALVGTHTNWSLVAILVALFAGLYLQRINYAFMVIGITVMVSQLYVQLGEFSHALLWLRLEETALGAGVAIATVVLVLPLPTRRVARVAMRQYLEALGTLVDHARTHLVDAAPEQRGAAMRSDARGVDAAYQALLTTLGPLRRTMTGSVDEPTATALRLAGASRNYARNMVLDAEVTGVLDAVTGAEVARGIDTLAAGLRAVAGALTGPAEGRYIRAASIFDRAGRRSETNGTLDGATLVVRDLTLLDGALATLAEAIGVEVTDLDTSRCDSAGQRRTP